MSREFLIKSLNKRSLKDVATTGNFCTLLLISVFNLALGFWSVSCIAKCVTPSIIRAMLILFQTSLFIINLLIIRKIFVGLRTIKNEIAEVFKTFENWKQSDFFELDNNFIDKCTLLEFVKMNSYIHELILEFLSSLEEQQAIREQLQATYDETLTLYDELQQSYFCFAKQLSFIAENYDQETGNHIERVGILSAFIAEKFGLEKEKVNLIRVFAPLHDIGKILIPQNILNKRGRLTDEEFEIVKKHTIYGAKLIGKDPFFEVARNIALYHHEKYDGSGYPFGLRGDEIPIEAQIVALVDVYDALRSERPYKKAYSHFETLEILFKGDDRTSHFHFNPRLLSILLKHSKEIDNLWNSCSSQSASNFLI